MSHTVNHESILGKFPGTNWDQEAGALIVPTVQAKEIATWLRDHGYDRPIYYYGFGEGLPAVRSGDGVDEPRNRRALYLVGANPPPPGSGVPSVGWIAL